LALSTQQQMLVEQRLANEKKSTGISYLLWFFLGAFGAHRLYLGKIGSAIAMICLFWGGAVLSLILVGYVLLLAYGIWWLVDAFLIPGMVERDAQQRRLRIAQEVDALAGG
jgi:TM2 domain-containing membrane protein YozV